MANILLPREFLKPTKGQLVASGIEDLLTNKLGDINRYQQQVRLREAASKIDPRLAPFIERSKPEAVLQFAQGREERAGGIDNIMRMAGISGSIQPQAASEGQEPTQLRGVADALTERLGIPISESDVVALSNLKPAQQANWINTRRKEERESADAAKKRGAEANKDLENRVTNEYRQAKEELSLMDTIENVIKKGNVDFGWWGKALTEGEWPRFFKAPTPDTQKFVKLISELLNIRIRNRGFSGKITNEMIKNEANSIVSLLNTPDGALNIINDMRRTSAKNIDRGKAWRDLRAKYRDGLPDYNLGLELEEMLESYGHDDIPGTQGSMRNQNLARSAQQTPAGIDEEADMVLPAPPATPAEAAAAPSYEQINALFPQAQAPEPGQANFAERAIGQSLMSLMRGAEGAVGAPGALLNFIADQIMPRSPEHQARVANTPQPTDVLQQILSSMIAPSDLKPQSGFETILNNIMESAGGMIGLGPVSQALGAAPQTVRGLLGGATGAGLLGSAGEALGGTPGKIAGSMAGGFAGQTFAEQGMRPFTQVGKRIEKIRNHLYDQVQKKAKNATVPTRNFGKEFDELASHAQSRAINLTEADNTVFNRAQALGAGTKTNLNQAIELERNFNKLMRVSGKEHRTILGQMQEALYDNVIGPALKARPQLKDAYDRSKSITRWEHGANALERMLEEGPVKSVAESVGVFDILQKITKNPMSVFSPTTYAKLIMGKAIGKGIKGTSKAIRGLKNPDVRNAYREVFMEATKEKPQSVIAAILELGKKLK